MMPDPVRDYRTSKHRAWRGALVFLAGAASFVSHAENSAQVSTEVARVNALSSADSNVPDVVTRQTGLRVSPMARPARIYAENCEGCHGWAGVSVTEIPTLKGRIGYFARLPEGRRYLVQVPNVALNPSSDEDIAAMMNWLLRTYSRHELPAGFVPYSAAEVAQLRKARIDVAADRRRVIAALVAAHEIPSPDVLAIPHASLY
jgi:mono/diheme cytochrome c family protein